MMTRYKKSPTIKKSLNRLQISIEAKKKEMEYLHSEADLNTWGYSLMNSGDLEKALAISVVSYVG